MVTNHIGLLFSQMYKQQQSVIATSNLSTDSGGAITFLYSLIHRPQYSTVLHNSKKLFTINIGGTYLWSINFQNKWRCGEMKFHTSMLDHTFRILQEEKVDEGERYLMLGEAQKFQIPLPPKTFHQKNLIRRRKSRRFPLDTWYVIIGFCGSSYNGHEIKWDSLESDTVS